MLKIRLRQPTARSPWCRNSMAKVRLLGVDLPEPIVLDIDPSNSLASVKEGAILKWPAKEGALAVLAVKSYSLLCRACSHASNVVACRLGSSCCGPAENHLAGAISGGQQNIEG